MNELKLKHLKNEKCLKIAICSWQTKGRDYDLTFPLMYLCKKLNHNIRYFHPTFRFDILSWSPDIIFITNSNGAIENVKFIRLARKYNIPTYSHISEGLFREKDIDEFVCGWNKQNEMLENLTLFWSKEQLDMTLKYYPEKEINSVVSGALSIDKYFLHNVTANKNYEIGIAGFDFNSIILKTQCEIEKQKYIKSANAQYLLIKQILKLFPEINIIFRPHPGDSNAHPLEIGDIQSDRLTICNHESLLETINSCKIWISFNSTTSIDARLMGVHSILYNPDDTISFIENQKIIPRYSNAKDIINEITDCLQNKNDKTNKASDLKKLFGFLDGKNFIRAYNVIINHYESEDDNNFKITDKFLMKVLNKIQRIRINAKRLYLKFFFPDKLLKYNLHLNNFDLDDLKCGDEIYISKMNEFIEKAQ